MACDCIIIQIYSQLSVKRTFFGWIHSPEVTTDGTGLQLCLFTPRGQQFDSSLAIFEFLILSSPMGSPLGGTPRGQKWPKIFFQFLNFFCLTMIYYCLFLSEKSVFAAH